MRTNSIGKAGKTKRIVEAAIENFNLNEPADIGWLGDFIIEEVNRMYDLFNTGNGNGMYWKLIHDLTPDIIEIILLNLFHIRRISLCDCMTGKSTILGIYVDDYVEYILENMSENKGIYITDEEVFIQIMLYFNAGLSISQCDNILRKLNTQASVVKRNANANLIALKSTLFDYDNKKIMEFSPEYVFLNKIKVDYNPHAKNIVIHNEIDGYDFDIESWFLELACGDEKLCDLLWQVTSAVIRPTYKWNKMVLLSNSSGCNGKGSLLFMYREIVGRDACASISFSQMNKEFSLTPLLRTSVILTDENDTYVKLKNTSTMKAIVTQDIVQINRKFKEVLDMNVKTFCIQCINSDLLSYDITDSFYRRQLIIPMNANFTGSERTYIKEEYLKRTDVLEYVVKRVLEDSVYGFSDIPDSCVEALNYTKEINNSVISFWEQHANDFVWSFLPFSFLFDMYKAYCNRYKPHGRAVGYQDFIKQIENIIRKDNVWVSQGRTQIYIKKNMMIEQEPLIWEYNLNKWMSDNKNDDYLSKCVPCEAKRKKHAGILRNNLIDDLK